MVALDALASPRFAQSAPLRLNGRSLGLVIAVWVILDGISFAAEVFRARVDWLVPGVLIQVLLGALLPTMLATAGGLYMVLGDPRGKRLVVLSLGLGLGFALLDMWGASRWQAPLATVADALITICIAASWYYLVVTSRFDDAPGSAPAWRVVLPSALAIWVGIVVALVTVSTLIERLLFQA